MRTGLYRTVQAAGVAVLGLLCVAIPTRTDARACEHHQEADGDREVTVAAIAEVADISNVVPSPDGNWVAFRVDRPDVAANRIAIQWHVAALDGHRPAACVADGGLPAWYDWERDEERPVWSADSRTIYFRALHGEELAVWRAGLDGVVTKVTGDEANVESFRLSGANQLLYVVGPARAAIQAAEQTEYLAGIRLDETVDVQDNLYRNQFYRGRMTTIRCVADQSRCGPLLAEQRRLRVLDLATRLTRDADAAEAAAYWHEVGPAGPSGPPSPSGRRQLLVEPIGQEQRPEVMGANAAPNSRYRVGWRWLRTNEPSQFCASGACDGVRPDYLTWRPVQDRDEIVFLTVDAAGNAALHAWDTDRGRVRSVIRFTGLLGAGVGGAGRKRASLCPMTARFALCTTSDADAPPRLEAIDLDSGSRRILFDPNRALRRARLGRVEELEWRDRWGRPVTGQLVLPPGSRPSGPIPLVITSYRCTGFLRGGGGGDVPEFVLAASGIAALCVNADASLNDRPHPSGIPVGQQARLQSVLDAWHSGVDLLQRRGIVDPARVGVSGLSFGAEAARFAITFSDRFAVAAASHGGIDPLTFTILGTRPRLASILRDIYGVPPPSDPLPDQWQAFSSALNIGRIRAPILIQTDEAEFRQALQFIGGMATAGKPIEVFVFPDEAHQFLQPAHVAARNQRNIDWFRFWLQGFEDPDPAKREQYARWRAMRTDAESVR